MGLYNELSAQKEVILNELAMLEDKIAIAQYEWDSKKKQLDEIEKCLRALEEEK